jgi:DnaJ like chaperone protein
MAELRLDGAQIHAAIAHFTRGKSRDFDLQSTMEEFSEACVNRPDLVRVFLEVQVRAALEGVDMKGPAALAIQKVADLLDVSRIELAHMEAVLRLRREQFRHGPRNGNGNNGNAGHAPPRSGMQLNAAYQILEVDPKATDEEVAKAYRRQLSKHHPDKLKANGLPDSMLEHAKQRTQQIIEAYELIKSTRGA